MCSQYHTTHHHHNHQPHYHNQPTFISTAGRRPLSMCSNLPRLERADWIPRMYVFFKSHIRILITTPNLILSSAVFAILGYLICCWPLTTVYLSQDLHGLPSKFFFQMWAEVSTIPACSHVYCAALPSLCLIMSRSAPINSAFDDTLRNLWILLEFHSYARSFYRICW